MMAAALLALWIALPPCALEDDLFCSWDASQQGSGQGSNFINLGDDIFYRLP